MRLINITSKLKKKTYKKQISCRFTFFIINPFNRLIILLCYIQWTFKLPDILSTKNINLKIYTFIKL